MGDLNGVDSNWYEKKLIRTGNKIKELKLNKTKIEIDILDSYIKKIYEEFNTKISYGKNLIENVYDVCISFNEYKNIHNVLVKVNADFRDEKYTYKVSYIETYNMGDVYETITRDLHYKKHTTLEFVAEIEKYFEKLRGL